jgi:hypothetical protein
MTILPGELHISGVGVLVAAGVAVCVGNGVNVGGIVGVSVGFGDGVVVLDGVAVGVELGVAEARNATDSISVEQENSNSGRKKMADQYGRLPG